MFHVAQTSNSPGERGRMVNLLRSLYRLICVIRESTEEASDSIMMAGSGVEDAVEVGEEVALAEVM